MRSVFCHVQIKFVIGAEIAQWYSSVLLSGGFESRYGLEICPFTTVSRPDLGPTYGHIQ